MKIPWSETVQVLEFEPWRHATLAIPGGLAQIEQSGRFDIAFDSRDFAKRWMKLDEERTQELRRFMHLVGFDRVPDDPAGREMFFKYLESWVTPHPSRSPRGGVEWPKGREGWKLGILGASNTQRFMHFLGSPFDYVHFVTSPAGEGAVILWWEPARGIAEPEIWVGPFEDFVRAQQPESTDAETFLKMNDLFENGFLWAITELGGFEAFGHYLQKEVVDAIGIDPYILHQGAIDKIVAPRKWPRALMEERLTQYPEPIQRAVRTRTCPGGAC